MALTRLTTRTAAALWATLLLLTGAALAGAPAASATASAGLVTCPVGTQTTTYSPGLRLPATPAPTVSLHTDGTLGPCVSLDGHHTGAVYKADGSGKLNCLGGNSSGGGSLNWSDPGAATSKFTFTGGISLRPDGVTVLVLNGTVTSGDFAGKHLVVTVVLLSTDLTACLTPTGLTTSSGPFTASVL
ncbi:hypothetical protein [Streptomyces sp. NPDC003717]|uniref:hypothetical protein n=1 Tax=Streptomyces sp. NPDC003717 TaxID=3154276 RepID=UPI0033A8D61E